MRPTAKTSADSILQCRSASCAGGLPTKCLELGDSAASLASPWIMNLMVERCYLLLLKVSDRQSHHVEAANARGERLASGFKGGRE